MFAVSVSAAATVAAQTVPTGVQEYYVLGWEQHIWDMMDRVQNAQGGAQFADGMNSVVTATASADNQVVYYDHWEDGPDSELDNFPGVNPAALQSSTVVIGDGDPSNGDLCDFNANYGCPSADIVMAGDYINFNSDRGLGCTAPDCSVPLNPRDPADVHFDGGDLIKTTGGPLTLIHSQYPLTNYIGGSIEILSRQAVEAARSYSVPIGEDLYAGGTPTEPFHYVELELVAFEDTSITVDSPGAGSVSFTLGRGEHWSSMGFINDSAFPALELTINAGTKVSTTAPISGLIFTGGDGTWATRLYTLLPDILHSTDYVTTAPGDDPTGGPTTNGTPQDRPANVYILNPDLLTSIDVQITDDSGSYTVTIPPNSMRSMDDIGAGRDIAPNSTVRMTSDRNFWGVTAYDYNTNISDWGHSWLAKKFLTNTYTVSFGPGNQNQPPDGSQYGNPVFVAATADRTRVQFDLENDGIFDWVDLDGDGTPDPPTYAADTSYEVNMLAALRVTDPGDNDMTGARIVANKPVAVSWGQDTDRSYYNDQALDTGFTIYPVNQLFLDPALTIDKEVDTTAVPTASLDPADRTVTYTLTVRSYGFGPLTDVQVWDQLPAGVVADDTPADSDYVHGSTLITCPNLVQGTSDPEFGDCAGGDGLDCGRLSWDIEAACGAGFTLGTNKTLTIRYQVAIPESPGGPRLLTNTGHAQATLGGSVFSPSDTARVVQTDVVFTKTVDKQTLPAGDVLTFNLTVENTGASAESNVFISDPIPPDTTYCDATTDPGVCVNPSGGAPFGSGVFDPSQNAVVWSAGTFDAAALATLSFQVRVNPTVPAGTEIPNRGGYESDETPYFLSNEVDPVVLGPALDAFKSIVGDPAVVHPTERVTFEIVIENTGTAAATNVFLRDAFPDNAAYVAGTIRWSLNSAPFTTLTDANDGDEGGGADGRAFADRMEYRLASLGPSQNVAVRFDMIIDAGTAGEFLIDQAVFASDATPSTDTNLVQVPIVGDAVITGHVFLDLDADGTQDAGEPNLSSVDVVITDAGGVVQRVSTDANGDYAVTVEAGTATVNVDETDADFPTNAVLTTANDPQDVVAVSGATRAASDVGYDPPPLTFSKTSDAVDHEVSPGDTITYTLRAVNATGVAQTGVTVTDPLPAGTSAVTGSTSVTVTNPVFRVSEYVVPAGAFPDTAYELTLGEDLVANYFVIVQGSANTSNQDRGPDADYARLTGDPFGTGDLTASGNSRVLQFARGAGDDDWEGVVTVVECLSACATAGFQLRSVEAVGHTGTAESGTEPVTGGWNDINQVLLMGGFNGAGCTTAESTDRNHPVCHARFYPEESPGDLIHWTRDGSNGSVSLGNAISTVMVVEWGSEWSVQRVQVTGTNGGNGLDTTGEYTTATLNPSVTRGETWVWGTGHADGQGIGDQAEGVAYTLGDGVNQGATEGSVAAGTEYGGTSVDFEIYVMSHPDLAVDYRFKADGDNGSATVDVTVDNAGGQRMAVASNGQGATDDNYPRPLFSARYLNDTTVRLERKRTGETFPAWVEGIDFTGIVGVSTFAGHDPEAAPAVSQLVPGPTSGAVSLGPSGTIEVTFQVTVDPDLDPAATPQIANTATLDTVEESPLQASVTDDVVEVAVVVEYDNAGFGLTGDTVNYYHEVVNRGSRDDAFVVTLASELHWPVALVDPDTGGVIASDEDGDGAWDGGVVVNTGSLSPGEAAQYILRITVAGGEGSAESTSLVATSQRDPGVSARATDETVAIGSLDPTTHPVIVLPDNSGVAEIGGTAVYNHRVINNTGATDTFDLTGWSELGWDFTFFWDADGNGVYSDGVDVAITNTLQLADGASQLFFVVVEATSGGDNTEDVLHIAASSRKNYDEFFGTATDTTTISPPTILDLSGGGTRTVDGGESAVFPGTLRNLTDQQDTYNLSISEAWFYGFDSFLHPTEFWIDEDNDGQVNGVIDTLVAVDIQGDGVWDTVNADTDGDGAPDIDVAGGGELAYLLRRAVDTNQNSMRDPVTLTATATNTADTDSITATVLLAAPTAAVLANLDVYAVDGQVVVAWRTAAEVGTIGFDLWRWREGQTGYERVNSALVPGLRHIQGGTYRLVDPAVSVGETVVYFLYENDVWGRGDTFGPFEVVVEERGSPLKTAQALASGESREVNRSSVRRASTKSAPAGGTPSGLIKILVRTEGLVRLSANALADVLDTEPAVVSGLIADGDLWIATGLDAGPPDTELFSDGFESGDLGRWGAGDKDPNQQEGVAWMAVDGADALVFWAEAIDSIYTRDNVYWLGVGRGLRMETRPAAVIQTKTLGSFPETIHFEEEQWPLTSVMTDPEADFWMWDYFFPYDGEPVVTRTFNVATPGVALTSGPAQLTVRLQGSLEADVADNHIVGLRLNGTDLGGAWRWSDHDLLSLEVDFPQAILNDGDNALEITASLVEGLEFDEFYLDSIDLSYQRLHLASGDRLLATAGGAPAVTVDGFSDDEILVLDLTSSKTPVVLTGVLIEPGSQGYSAHFGVSNGSMPFAATTVSAVNEPAALAADFSSNLKDPANRGRYVVVAGPGLEGEAEALAAYREEQGLSAVVAPVVDIFDEFNGGVVNPWAIRDFLRFAYENWAEAPEYVFLAGDGTLDYKNVWGADENLVPAPMTVAHGGLVPSDNSLADWIGDDGVPEVAIGRLPAQYADELRVYRDKIAAFESGSGDWKRRTLWLADAADEGGEFPEDLLGLANELPATFTSERIVVDWLGPDRAREQTLESWNNGAVMVEFLGHGALDFIANNELVTTGDVASMTNHGRTPFFSALTCMVGRFDIPDYDILSEALLLENGRGSIGVWSPSAFSMNADAALLGSLHVDAVASGNHETVGDSIRAALDAYAASGVGDPVLPRIFIFLGDPATRMKW